jgi:predicted nucleic acid-binding protein
VTTLTFDTGALIGLERNRQRMRVVFKTARVDGTRIIVPGMCIAEWWRGRTDVREKILAAVIVVHTDEKLVKATGEALARVPGATCIDALVMATAARYGGVVFTSDVSDLLRLQKIFPSVRVLGA